MRRIVPGVNMDLNSDWRIIEHRQVTAESAPISWYWRLERKDRWKGWVFSVQCATRNALIRHVKSKCGDVKPETIKELTRLPTYLNDKYYKGNRRR